MTSLSQLNESAASPIEVTDDRPAGVLFDRFATRDNIFTISNLNKTLVPTIEISEIINYATANVRYRLTINSTRSQFISNSSLTFVGMPTGVSVATVTTTYAKQYTVTGFKSAANWQQIKTPTWNIHSDFALANTFYVKAEIIYYDAATSQDVTREWFAFDPRYYYFAQLSSQTAVSALLGRSKKYNAALTSNFTFNTDAPFTRFTMFTTAQSFVTANGRKARLLNANLSTNQFTLVAAGKYNTASGAAAITSAMTVICIGGEIVRLINQAAFVAVAGRIGPGGVSFIEGNGLPYYNADGSLLNIGGLPPGITRIKQGVAAVSVSSTVTCIGADARLVSAMVMSSGTVSCNVTRIPGIIKNLTSSFSVNLPDSGSIEGGRAQFGGEFSVSAQISNIKLVSASVNSLFSVNLTMVSDAPALPTLNFTTNEVTVAQTLLSSGGGFDYSMGIVGKRADGYHRIFARNNGTGKIRLGHNDTQSGSDSQILSSTSSQNIVSTQIVSNFSTSTDGGIAFALSSGLATKAHLINVQNYSSTPTQTSIAGQAIPDGRGTEIAGALKYSAIALCPTLNSTSQKAIVVQLSNPVSNDYGIVQTKHRWTTNAFDYTSSATSATGATAGSANHQRKIRVSGFTSNDTTARYAFSYFDSSTTMKIRICTTSTADDTAATATSTGDVFTIPLVDGSVVIQNGALCTVWDDYANSKFVSVAMAADQGNIYLKAVRVNNWSTLDSTLGAQKTVTGYGDDVDTTTARLIPVKTVNGIVGQALLTYQRTNIDDAIYGRFISVNSTTLQVDIGAETYLGSSNASTSVSIEIADYVVDIAKDGNEYAFALCWKERNSPTSNTRGGTTFTTATAT